jgi:hypothetical protein
MRRVDQWIAYGERRIRERDVRLLEGVAEFVLELSGDEDVVGRDAGLAGVDDFAP